MFRFGFQTAASKPENSAAFLEQELSHCGIYRQTDRSAVGVCGLTRFPKTLKEVSAKGPIRLIVRNGVAVNRLENGQPRFRSLCFSNCGCSEAGDKRVRRS